MKHDVAVKTILQRWMTLWPGLSGSTPYVFDNDVNDQSPFYARVSITTLDEEQHTLGGVGTRKFLEPGIINVKLYGPGNAGRGPLDVMADYVRQIYQSTRFGALGVEEGIQTFETSITELRPKTSAQYWILVTKTAFEFFDVR